MTDEKRTPARNSTDAIFDAVRDMNNKIITHMREEEEARITDMAAIREQLKPLNDLVDSVPRDERGVPSIYLHRVHHENIASAAKSTSTFKDGFMAEAGRLLLLAIIVLIASGNWEHILKRIIG